MYRGSRGNTKGTEPATGVESSKRTRSREGNRKHNMNQTSVHTTNPNLDRYNKQSSLKNMIWAYWVQSLLYPTSNSHVYVKRCVTSESSLMLASKPEQSLFSNCNSPLCHTVQLRPERIVTCHIALCHTSQRSHPPVTAKTYTQILAPLRGRMSHRPVAQICHISS